LIFKYNSEEKQNLNKYWKKMTVILFIILLIRNDLVEVKHNEEKISRPGILDEG